MEELTATPGAKKSTRELVFEAVDTVVPSVMPTVIADEMQAGELTWFE
jgi:hypothetical protein